MSDVIDTGTDIFLIVVIVLGILAGLMVLIAILAATWVVVTGFISQYRKSAKILAQEEAEAAALENPNY